MIGAMRAVHPFVGLSWVWDDTNSAVSSDSLSTAATMGQAMRGTCRWANPTVDAPSAGDGGCWSWHHRGTRTAATRWCFDAFRHGNPPSEVGRETLWVEGAGTVTASLHASDRAAAWHAGQPTGECCVGGSG